MAYHDAHLSSEVAYAVGDDDIDIDIDILPGQNDEDYILEDAQSENSHEIGNDDLMIDDENTSYQMNDIDVVQDETMVNMQMEDADLVETRESESVNGGMNISGEDLTFSLVDVHETSVARMDDKHAMEPSLDAEDLENKAEDANYVNTDLSDENEAHSDPPPKSSPQGNARAPGVHDLLDHHSQEHSSPKSELAQDDQEYKWAATDSQPTAVGDEDFSDIEQEVDVTGGAVSPISVIVIYKDVEYSLIATSESDDPDTYFLQDGVLTKAPLADFFAALRDVIHEDLAVDDELCLNVNDLGLEISETSISAHETTFISLIELYERLLDNDGVGTPAPIRVTLGTKTDFAKRVELLLAGAAEGKGLSEFVACDDESENHENARNHDRPEENTRESKGNVEEDEHTNGVVEFVGAGEDETSYNLLVGDHVSEDVASEHITKHNPDAVEPEDTPNNASGMKLEVEHGRYVPSASNLAEEDRSRSKAATVTAQQIGYANRASPDVDEDGDLIDYSEDDYEQEALRTANVKKQTDKSSAQDGSTPVLLPPCLKPNFCFCTPCNNELLLTEYEESEKTHERPVIFTAAEKGVQRPTSLSLEEAAHPELLLDQSTATQDGYGRSDVQEDKNEDGEQNFLSHEQHVDREHEDGQGFEVEKEVDADNFEENQVPFDEVEQAQEEVENGVGGLEHEEAPEIPDRDKLNNDSIPHANDEDLEIDYDLRDQDSESAQPSGTQTSDVNNEQHYEAIGDETKDVEDEISYEDDDFREFNQSDHTLVADGSSYNSEDGGNEVSGNAQALEDEISYETDDHQELNHPSANKAPNGDLHELNGRIGKRHRGDAEDATQQSSKQSKRARS